MNFSLFDSFFPNGTQLRNANQTFKFILQKSTDLLSPVKHYGERIIYTYEMAHNNITTMREELKQKDDLLNAHKKCKTGKRIVIKKKFVFTTEEILQLMKKAEAENAIKKMRKKPRKHPIQEVLEDNEDETLENEDNSSDFDCIVLRPRK